MISAETRFPVNQRINDFVSVGLLSYYDRAGSAGMQTLTAYPAINYNKSLEDENSSFLSVGFTGGYIQRNFDVTKITVDNQYQGNAFSASNPTGENIPLQKFGMWDLGAGVTFSSNSSGSDNATTYYIGASGYHFTKPRNSFFNYDTVYLNVRWNGTAGMSMKLNEDYSAQFHANYSKQGSASEIIAGGLVSWNKPNISTEGVMFSLGFGAFYRFGDAITPVAELKYKDLSISASYDLNVSKLKAGTNLRGGLELSVFKTGLFNNPNMQKSRTICPTASW
jgi:type IX secretion system PorP/SprF family membrane protein